jgi:hypothetical protein
VSPPATRVTASDARYFAVMNPSDPEAALLKTLVEGTVGARKK